MRVLLVEDNQIEAELLRELLADCPEESHWVQHVPTLAAAIAWLAAAALPDIVLLDFNLPDTLDMQGLRQIRDRAPGVPILVLTNSREQGLDQRVLREGAQDFLSKARLRSASLYQAMRRAVARQAYVQHCEQDGVVPVDAVGAASGAQGRADLLYLIAREISRARRGRATSAAVVVVIPDLNGRRVGDRIGDSFGVGLREDDAWGRLADNAVAVLLTAIESPDRAVRVIRRRLAGTAGWGSHPLTASLGIAMCDPASASAEALLDDALAAGRRAAALGRECCVADSVLDERTAATLKLETELADGLRGDEFRVAYQPQVALDTGQVRGFEALLRWQHPDRGLLPAGAFIHVAEQSGIIVEISRFVLATAVPQINVWQRLFPVEPALTISINLSARCLEEEGFADAVLGLLDADGLAASRLRLELARSGFAALTERGRQQHLALRAAGVAIDVDDFEIGEGAAVAGLLRGEIDALKIGRDRLHAVSSNTTEAIVLESVAALGRSLGLEVIATGVETAEQAAWLRAAGIPQAQGHWFAGAMTRDAVVDLMSRPEGHYLGGEPSTARVH